MSFTSSNTQIGYLTSAFLGFYMIAAPFVGPLADRYSRKLIIVLGAVFWSGLTLLTAVTHTYTELLIRHTLVGVGEATFVTIAPTFVADLFAEKIRGRILGVFYLAIPVGSAAGYLLGGYLAPHHGWRFPFYIAAAPGFLLALAVLFLKEPERGQFDSLKETPERGNDSGIGAQSGLSDFDAGHGGDDVFAWRHSGVDPASFCTASGLHAGGCEFRLWDHHRRRWNSGGAGWGMAGRLSAAADEGFVLSGFGGEHAAGNAGHDRGAIRQRAGDDSGDRRVGIFSSAQYCPAQCGRYQFCGSAHSRTALAVNIFIIHLLGDVPSPAMMGWVADRRSLQTAFVLPVIAMGISSAILFYGMKFAPAVAVDGHKALNH